MRSSASSSLGCVFDGLSPAVLDLVLQCADDWDDGNERTAVVCCGLGSMVDDAQAATMTAIGKGCDAIRISS
jgi:hypothetical protein